MRAAAHLLLRLAAAAALLAFAVWLVGPQRLRASWEGVDRAWFLAALATAALAQVVSVLRWRTIARIFSLTVRLRPLALAYAQGMTLNVLLPGATLGGDALRSVRLQALGNPLGESALTVLLDRLSGLWVLCGLSLITAAVAAAAGAADAGHLPPGLPVAPDTLLWGYCVALALAVLLPWLPFPSPHPTAAGVAARLWRRLCELHALALSRRLALARSLWSSILVQLLSAATLFFCVRAAGTQASYWQVQAVAAPIFVAGALPISYGGFGAREVAALVAFPLVGLSADAGLAASVLYGMVAVVLGLVAAPSLAWSPGRTRAAEAR